MASSPDERDIEKGAQPSVRFAVKDDEKERSESPEEEASRGMSDQGTFKTSEGIEMMLYDEDPPTCWSRIRGEWKLTFFSLSETDDAMIDVRRSFAPPPFLRTFLIKAIITGATLAILVTDMTSGQWDPVSYYFIYLSHWTLALTTVYLFVSLTITIIGVPQQRPYDDIPNFVVRLAWGLYPTAEVSQMITTLFFWVRVYDPNDSITAKMVMKHGGLMVLVLLEGLSVNRIPVRQKHLLFPMLFMALYVIWTGLHDALDVGNPYSDGNAIYESWDWTNNWQQALVTSIILLLVVTPLLFLNVWLISIWSFPFHFDGLNRHHLYLEEKEEKSSQSWWDSIVNWTSWRHRNGELS